MSARLLGTAYSVAVSDGSEKNVLVKLVDCAHDNGRSIYASIGTIARECSLDRREVSRVLETFRAIGLLLPEGEHVPKPGAARHWRIDLEMLHRWADSRQPPDAYLETRTESQLYQLGRKGGVLPRRFFEKLDAKRQQKLLDEGAAIDDDDTGGYDSESHPPVHSAAPEPPEGGTQSHTSDPGGVGLRVTGGRTQSHRGYDSESHNPLVNPSLPLDPPTPQRGDVFADFWSAYPSRGVHTNPELPARQEFGRLVETGAIDAAALTAAAAAYRGAMADAGLIGSGSVLQAVNFLRRGHWKQYAALAGDVALATGKVSPPPEAAAPPPFTADVPEAWRGPWERIRERLRAEMGDGVYRSWLQPLVLSDTGGPVLLAPTRFMCSRVTSLYGDRIGALWRAELPDAPEVRIEVAPLGRGPP